MVEVPQIQFVDKLFDALVSMQRQIPVLGQIDAGVSLDITGAMTPHRKRKGVGRLPVFSRIRLCLKLFLSGR